MDARLIESCVAGSFAGTTAFPEIVDRLRAESVERYVTDLMQLHTTYYAADGAAQVVPLPLSDAPSIADAFNVVAVCDALATAQRREIGYPEFLRRMMAAGTVGYTVFINGQQTQYVGRHGDSYAEPFRGWRSPRLGRPERQRLRQQRALGHQHYTAANRHAG